ncbi:MAG: VWA domain-containing protein [Acidobacteriaceae bacterium]|nr:VWA domain-containing protein [Acidobacteriaceae bacterium]
MNRQIVQKGLRPTPRRAERGASLVLFLYSCFFVLFPFMSFGFDWSILYWTKARLSSAIDAAALAAARSLTVDQTGASQTGAAAVVAQKYLNANFPPGLMGITVNFDGTNANNFQVVDDSTYKTHTVIMKASATVPLFFARMIGKSTGVVASAGQATRRDLNLMLVLDRTGSIQQAGACPTMKAAAASFVSMFADGRDTVGLVTFMASANLDYPMTKSFKSSSPSLNDQLATLVCANNTGSAEAFSLAYQQMLQLNQPGALNVIVFFTDGHPNTTTAYLPIWPTDGSHPCAGPYDGQNSFNENVIRGIMIGTSGGGIYPNWVDPNGNVTPNGYGPPAINSSGPQVPLPNPPYSGCSFSGTSNNNVVAYLPDQDEWGNSLDNGYQPVARYPGSEGDGNGMQDGHIRIDDVITLQNAAINAVDDAANRARHDPLGILVYTVGLGDDQSDPPDADLMQRMANDPASSSFDPSIPAGRYIYVSNAAALNAAFHKIASLVLRLSK